MEKGLLKRIIAREWLILVGSLLVGFIGVLLLSYEFGMKYRQELSQRAEQYAKLEKEYESLHKNDEVSQLEKQYAKLEREYYWERGEGYEGMANMTLGDLQRGDLQRKRDSWLRERLPPGSIEKIHAESKKRKSWLAERAERLPPEPNKPDELSEWFVIFPYIITQFIRSIVWAFKKVLLRA